MYAVTSDENSSKESLDLCNVYPYLLSQGINSNLNKQKVFPQQISQFPAPTTETWKNYRIELYCRKRILKENHAFLPPLDLVPLTLHSGTRKQCKKIQETYPALASQSPPLQQLILLPPPPPMVFLDLRFLQKR
jgi:hypothetical protein